MNQDHNRNEKEKLNKKSLILLPLLLILLLLAVGVLQKMRPSTPQKPETPVVQLQTESQDRDPEHPKAPSRNYLKYVFIPPYSGKAYISINNGEPFFDTATCTTESYEIYYDLDELGRCTLADAVVGQDLMPTKKRGSISSVKPTGWHTDKYPKDLVDGESLYNRCHLIAFGLTGEEANKYNLVTGTRYFNTKGINALENMVIDYIRETGNHVRYRVTPVFSGENLICDGQVVEAWSIEDEGEGICFNVYSYNVQPGIGIDYATGDNWLEDGTGERPADSQKKNSNNQKKNSNNQKNAQILEEDVNGSFVLNIKKKKVHAPDCPGLEAVKESNKEEYEGSLNDLLEKGFTLDESCIHIQ